MFSGLHMRPKCISSHPVDIDVFFYKPNNKPAGYSLLHPAVRKLAFAHDDDDGCLDVEDMPNGAFIRFRWNALRQRMAEEESGAWGSVDTRNVIVRLTGHKTTHATSKLLSL